jgi:hypothetical protein
MTDEIKPRDNGCKQCGAEKTIYHNEDELPDGGPYICLHCLVRGYYAKDAEIAALKARCDAAVKVLRDWTLTDIVCAVEEVHEAIDILEGKLDE